MTVMRSPVIVFDRHSRVSTLYDADGSEVRYEQPSHRVGAALHGVGVLGDVVISSATDLGGLAALQDDHEIVSNWQSSAKGAVCAYMVRPHGVLVLPDPMGTAALLYLEAGQYFVASTSMASLVAKATELGVSVQRDMEFSLEVAFLGGGAVSRTSYLGVERTEPFEYLSITDRVERRRYGIADWFWHERLPIAELFDRYVEDVGSSVRAVAGALGSNFGISHLTGGLDSRLVLAALMSQGVAEQFAYYTVGPRGTADRDVAEGLERSLGLAPTSFSGLRSPTFPSPVDASVAALVRSGGMSRQGPTGYEDSNDHVVLGGGHGELARSFYSRRFPAFDKDSYDVEQVALAVFGSSVLGPFAESRSLLRPQVRTGFLARFDDFLRSAAGQVPYSDYVLDYLYIYARNRNHIGLIQLSTSEFARRVDPLYSLSGAKLAQSTPLTSRASGLILFELLQRLRPALLEFPFDSPKFADDLWQVRRRPAERAFSGTLMSERTWPESARGRIIGNGVVRDPDSKREDSVRIAAKLNAPFWQVHLFDEASREIRNHLDEDKSEIVRYLNPTGVRWLMNNGLSHKAYVRQVVDLYTIIKSLGGE